MYSFDNSESNYQSKNEDLTIKELESNIIESVKNNVITFISSKTGSGKSTQVPQYLYNYMLKQKNNKSFNIICSEPRTIASDSIINFIKYKNKNIKILRSITKKDIETKEPKLFIVKENDLLFQLKIDPYLKYCDILIIDEVHERTMKLELLLYYIKYFTLSDDNNIKRGFRLVLMSATFDIDNIYSYFSSIKNKNITFGFVKQNELNEILDDNYDIVYSNYINNSLRVENTKFNEFNMGKILREIAKIVRYEVYTDDYNKKTILIFLPDYKTIYSLYNMLDKEYRGYIYLYQFSGALNIKQQKEIFNELWDNKRKEDIICNVIIATNLAETCLTFPNCDVVIDSGLKKNCKYNYECNLYEEIIEYISKDSCIQRSGRCGRGKNRGIVYRVFPEEIFNKMDKYRKSEIEICNIDLIILKLFETKLITEQVKNEVEKKGYLDFLSKIEKEKFDKIVNKLIKYKVIEKTKFTKYEIVTEFGKWIRQTNLDIELGYYFDTFKEKYSDELKKEVVFQMLNIISTTDNYNNELFYTDIDPEKFKLCLIDNQKEKVNSKTLVDLSQNISKNIVNNALIKYKNDFVESGKEEINNENNEENKSEENINNSETKINNFINNLNHVSPYYYLYSKLDEIYNGKNFFTKNKIFQLGDWTITLFFTIQYNLMKCLKHNYFPISNDEICDKCDLAKYFYCYVYSLNDKYFITKKNRGKHIKKALEIENNNEIFTVCETEEKLLSKWNMIYLNLISKKPDKYISENQIIKFINDFKQIDFNEIMDKIYDKYKELYINISMKYLEITRNEEEMLIQKKIFKNEEEENINTNSINENKDQIINNKDKNKYKIELYFNKLGKANLLKSYFFEFIPPEVDKYFILTKFRKILGSEKKGEKEIKLSKLYYKEINPIFDEMLDKLPKIKKHFETLKTDIIDKKEIKIYNNIGKYFYYHFISPKITEENLEIYHNSIIYLYSKTDKDIDTKKQKISDLINNEKENYYNMLDFIQCLKGDCLTIQLTQGLNVKNIYDTYQNKNINKNELLYEIEFKKDGSNNNDKDIKYYYKCISENKELTHEKLLILNDKLIIIFRNSLQFSLFSERQKLGLKLIPYKETISLNKDGEINNNNEENMKIFIIKFEQSFSNEEIKKKMKKYKKKLIERYNYKINFFIDENNGNKSKSVYYYIYSENSIDIPEKEIIGEECKEDLEKKVFYITWLSFSSDYNFFPKFREFCSNNNLRIAYRKQKVNGKIHFHHFTKKFELINYSVENMKLIQNYIGNTIISLNSFAMLELKSKSKDTFLEYNQNIFQYARELNCNITIIYYENKIIIYGEPNYRKKLYDILSNYFYQLQQEKIIYSLKGKEDSLLLKNICKKINQKQIVMLVSKNENGENQLEFRRKYINTITSLLNHQNKRKKTNKIKSTICEICLEKFDNENNNNYFKLKLCGHKFCIECLKTQICNSLKPDSMNNIPIKCVKCNTIISNKDIFELIIPNTPEYDFIIDKMISMFMLQISPNDNKKYHWCPNKKANCNYIYSSQMKDIGETIMSCPNCFCKICLLCNNILEIDKPHNESCKTKLYSNLNEKNRNWILKNSKDCPICHTVYEKNSGCNHMTCKICAPPTHFCYLCGCILNHINPLKHFSNKESLCYNKLWDDKKPNDISLEESHNENSKDLNDNNDSYINYNYSNKRRKKEDLNLTRIMVNKVGYNEAYKSNYYRNINSHFTMGRENYQNKRNKSYNKKYIPRFKK